MSELTLLPPYDGASRYVVPVREKTDGSKEALFASLGDISLHPAEQMLVIYAPGMPYATLYTYLDLQQIVGWIQEEQRLVADRNQTVLFEADE